MAVLITRATGRTYFLLAADWKWKKMNDFVMRQYLAAPLSADSDVAFPEKYVTENFHEIFRKISVEQEKCIYS